MPPEEIERFRRILLSLIEDIEELLTLDDSADSSIEPDKAIGRLTRMKALRTG